MTRLAASSPTNSTSRCSCCRCAIRGWRCIRCFTEPILLRGRAVTPVGRRRRGAVALESALTAPGLLFSMPGHGLRSQVEEAANARGIELEARIELRSEQALLAMVAAGGGIALVPAMSVAGRTDVVGLPLDPPLDREVGWVRRPGRHLPVIGLRLLALLARGLRRERRSEGARARGRDGRVGRAVLSEKSICSTNDRVCSCRACRDVARCGSAGVFCGRYTVHYGVCAVVRGTVRCGGAGLVERLRPDELRMQDGGSMGWRGWIWKWLVARCGVGERLSVPRPSELGPSGEPTLPSPQPSPDRAGEGASSVPAQNSELRTGAAATGQGTTSNDHATDCIGAAAMLFGSRMKMRTVCRPTGKPAAGASQIVPVVPLV